MKKSLFLSFGLMAAVMVSFDPVLADSNRKTSVKEVLAESDRLARDVARDDVRKPVEMIGFLGIEPHMQVLDVLSGGGYYTEIFHRYLKDGGRVVMFNAPPYLNYAKEELAERFADGRMKDIEQYVVDVADMDLQHAQFDAVFFGLGYHDLYYVSSNWPAIDRRKFLGELYASLKPGGIFGVTDHRSAVGADPAQSGQILHRIDPDAVIAEVEKAGFVFVAKSDAITRTGDDYTLSIFNPQVRGRTDRFALKFIKPVP